MLKDAIRRLAWLAPLLITSLAMASHKVRTSDAAVAQSLLNGGGKLIADYGSFQIIETDDPGAANIGGKDAALVDHQDFIQLNARRIDTRAAQAQSSRPDAPSFAGKRLRLVQFVGPVKPEWHEQLQNSGVRVVSYVPNNAYLIYGDAASVARVESQARPGNFVQWAGDYLDEDKVHPSARARNGRGGLQPGMDLFAIQLVEDAAANEATLALIDQLKLEPICRQSQVLDFVNIVVRLPPDRLDDIAARPEVVSIQPYVDRTKLDERQTQIMAGNISGGAPTGPGYLSWLTNKGFTGTQFTNSGFVVDVTDSGIDNGTTVPGHFALYSLGSTSLVSRVVYNQLFGTAHGGSTLEGCDGHGNLSAHIIGGFVDTTNSPHADVGGFSYGLGVCPFVKLGSSVVFDPTLFTFPDYEDLQSTAYQNGARISVNSWGAAVFGIYDIDAQAFDALVRDAQPGGSAYAVNSNQQMVIVFAAGNGGPDPGSIYSPASAKNVLTVGAAENVRSLSTTNGGNHPNGFDGCNWTDNNADSTEDIAVFSSRGPCSDGRLKPELVAPGSHVTGGVPQSSPAPSPSGTGLALACYDGAGICALPGGHSIGATNNYFPLGQEFYTVSSGTSQAAPAVAGAAALLRQYFINNSLTPPSPAMTKAFLANSARYMTGSEAGDTLWSTNQGMGELDLGMAFDTGERLLRDQVAVDKFTASGQARMFTGRMADTNKAFRVTLAWTDAPGSTTGNAYNNDLDLTVLVGGELYLGNVFTNQSSITGGSADVRNNMESVFLPEGLSTNFVVTVTAANINSDGVPNELPLLDQDFALVIYNASGAIVAISSYTVTATNCFGTNSIISPGDQVNFSLGLNNIGNANTQTNLTATLLATNGVAAPSGMQTYGILTPGGSSVTQSFSFTAVGTCGSSITATFRVLEGTNDLGVVTQTLPLGLVSLITTSHTNSSAITIPDLGIATPYPSDIMVAGATGLVSKVTVTLRDYNQTFPDDVDVLLVGPSGTNVLLMSDCGLNSPVTNVTLTFDSDVAVSLPNSTQIYSGTYKPSNYDTSSDTFPTNAPLAPFGLTLNVFNGTDPNGTWSLFVRDDDPDDEGDIAQGWVLTITTSNAVCCPPSANLAIGKKTSSFMITNGGNVNFTLNITNFGPDTATDVTVTDTLPSGFGFNSVTPSQGTWTNIGNTIVASLGAMTNTGIASVVINASGTNSGWWTNVATVSNPEFDVSSANNTGRVAVLVNSPPTISSIPDATTNINCVAGPVSFTVSDVETPAGSLTLSGASVSTNGSLVASIGFGGSGTNRTVSVTPGTNQVGTATIFVSVSDGFASVTNTFLLTIIATNNPPSLPAIANRTTYPLKLVSFTNMATDPDFPPQLLTFNLEAGAPGGSAVNPTNGVFTWIPSTLFVNTSNFISLRVTDNGLPPLSDTQSFAVLVVSPPLIQSITLSNTLVRVTWTTLSGETYRVQYKEDLLGPFWSNLQPDVVASGPTASKNDTNNLTTQRFYRVLVP